MTDQFDPTEMFWREEKDSHIKTIVYEIRMLRFSLSWLVKNGTQYRPEEELYAVLECFLLHYRNLVNFLSGKGGSSGDLSISAPNQWVDGKYDETEAAAIKKIAGPVYTAHSPDISTYLAHCTKKRYEQSKKWQPGKMYDELAPAIVKFEESFCGTKPEVQLTSVLGSAAYGTNSGQQYSVFPQPEGFLFIPIKKKS
jgi:hypothetical protein